MIFWVQRAPGHPEQLTAEQISEAFSASQVTWDTPVCAVGASAWTAVRHVPVLVETIRKCGAPSAAASAQPAQPPPPPPRRAAPAPASTDVVGYAQSELQREIGRHEQYREQLAAQAGAKQQELEAMCARIEEARAELASVEEALEVQSFGFYHPKYGFVSSDQYSKRLDEVRAKQEALLKADKATRCEKKWVVDGSSKRGAEMARDQSKLMLRAFNGECDAAIAKVKYDNVTSLEKRIQKTFDAINRLGASKHIEIAPEYSALKLEELYLVHEHREKVHEERETQRAIKEQMKEEQRADAEINQALERAQREEALKQEALETARRELADSTGRQHAKLEELVIRLESELTDALDRKARAIARAQLTRSGHVYVLSNLGCFGPDFHKIGMTRRLEPLERVQELGDASVPFQFDVHAMIYAEDAPTLERALHEAFADRRVNLINQRKEFFRVSLTEIQQAVSKLHGVVTFVTVPEAAEYHRTRALEAERRNGGTATDSPASSGSDS